MILTVREIIKQVRWCVDEESANIAEMAGVDENDNLYMDNIIKAKAYDALRWCLQYAPVDLLTGDGSAVPTDQSLINTTTLSVEPGNPTIISLPSGFQRLIRVRLKGWKKAVIIPIEEDSDKYLELSDETAKATNDRPVAALIRTEPKKLELWPGSETSSSVEVAYVSYPRTTSVELTDESTVYVPDKLLNAYLYYIAFLLMSAYGDSRASVMLSIAKMNLGLTE